MKVINKENVFNNIIKKYQIILSTFKKSESGKGFI